VSSLHLLHVVQTTNLVDQQFCRNRLKTSWQSISDSLLQLIPHTIYEYAVKNGLRGFPCKTKPLVSGYYWFRGFLRRHKDLVKKKAENLSVPRAVSMNKQQVSNWFEAYQTLATNLGIIDMPTHIYMEYGRNWVSKHPYSEQRSWR